MRWRNYGRRVVTTESGSGTYTRTLGTVGMRPPTAWQRRRRGPLTSAVTVRRSSALAQETFEKSGAPSSPATARPQQVHVVDQTLGQELGDG